MATDTDNSLGVVRKATPCLPSSAMFPMLTSPVQSETISRSGTDNCRGVDLKRSFKKFRSPKASSSVPSGRHRLYFLSCGCVSRHSRESLDISPSPKDDGPVPDKISATIATTEQHTESLINNISPESTPDESPIEVPALKDEEKRRGPFSRLRSYFSKRRRKIESPISHDDVSAINSPNMENLDPPQPSPNLENDLTEQVLYPFLMIMFIWLVSVYPNLFSFQRQTLLGPQKESDKGKKCFIIDLDETLVHSSFKVCHSIN